MSDDQQKSLNDFVNELMQKCFQNEPELPELTVEQIVGDQRQICRSLRSSLLGENKELKKVEERAMRIEQMILDLKSHFLADQQANQDALLSEKDGANGKLAKSSKQESSKKTLENIQYFGFNEQELSELPNLLEAPIILNSTNEKMAFNKGFLKYWVPVIRSEATCALLSDCFWWFYLTYFQNNKNEKDAFLYFSRIADSFAALFMSVDPSLRDRVFFHFSAFLAQAIYLTYYRAFPDSRLQLNDNFKRVLCDTVHEWMLGVKPLPNSFHQWKINDEINMLTALTTENNKQTSSADIIKKISNLEKMISLLGKQQQAMPPEEIQEVKVGSATTKKSGATSKKKAAVDATECLLEDGYSAEIVPFNIKGKSILISHYLKTHNLQEADPLGPKMTRTQII